ncbi:MAG: sugar ABC transporter permease [Clostridia bacterium]|nr:sugar ABC transporter permease [Clostridia bacterium]
MKKVDFSYTWKMMKQKKSGYLFVAPFFLLFLVFTVLPVCISIFFSFTHYNVLELPQWAGLDNYMNLFLHDDVFITAIKNTMIFAVVTGPVSYILCLIFAWFINELNRTLRTIFTILFYVPSISGGAYSIFSIIFNSDRYGLINGLLLRWNIITEPIAWFQDTRFMLTICIIVSLWMSLGTSFLAFIAGLQAVDRSLYEAGAMDGIQTRWHELWYITLPAMKPQLMFGAVMAISSSFSVGAVCNTLCGFPSTDYAAHTIIAHLEDYGTIRFEMGYACAIAALLFLLMIGTNKLINILLRRVGE